MPTRSYYVVLGISQTESRDGVRRAFRDLAQRYHPDRAGPKSTPFFQEIVTAYHTLVDPQRRASYDAGLRHADEAEPAVAPRTSPGAPAEPLVPRNSLRRDFVVTRPSRDEVFGRIRRNFSEERAPKAERMQDLRLELLISSHDALYGGVLTITVPVYYPCARCRGSGSLGDYACHACCATGIEEVEEPVQLRVPPGVRDGDLFQLPLRGLGIHNLYLSVCIRIGR